MSATNKAVAIGHVVFNLYSLRIGQVVDIRLISPRLGRYTSDLAVVELVEDGQHIRKVRWRLDNCRRFTPRAHRSRQAFLLLAQTLGVSPRRLWPRMPLWRRGFTKARQRTFIRRLRRICNIKVSMRTLFPQQTSNQVIAAVLAARVIPRPRQHCRS